MKRMIAILSACIATMILSINVNAQNSYEVKGSVMDSEGVVIGATIKQVGTSIGASTDLSGRYNLKVSSADAIVEISCIGYNTVTYKASAIPSVVTLAVSNQFLDEIVVIGYGTVKKSDMTGSVSTIKADQINKGIVTSPTELLRGKAAGVVVTAGDGAPGSAATVRIRGGSSLHASNDPLVIIDGLPISNSSIDGTSSALSSINPNDIESFIILKDASATAIYGSRASNGVIVITTKKGKTTKGIHVDADFTASLSQNTKFVDVMNSGQLRNAITTVYGENHEALNALGDSDTDWQREIYQLAWNSEANVSLSGTVGEKNGFYMPYRVSVGGIKQKGTLKTGRMTRETVSINLAPTFLKNRLTISLNAKGMNMDTRFADTDAIINAALYDPTKPVYDKNGLNGYSWWNNGKGTFTIDNCSVIASKNPVALINDKKDIANAKRFLSNAQFNYKVYGFEDLILNLNLGLDYTKSYGTVDVAQGTELSMHDTTQSGSGSHKYFSQLKRDETIELYADYSKTRDKHFVDLMTGYSWQRFYQESFSEEFSADGKGTVLSAPYTYKYESYLISFFGRINYSYDNRYLFTATLRRDGTSRFSNNKWGLFPSVAFGWNIKKESFLKDCDIFSSLKLRLSYGKTGQQDIGDITTLATYTLNTNMSHYVFGDEFLYPLTPKGYNADLKWETTTTYNAGLDWGVLGGRLYGSIDFYKRYTKDLLNWTPVPSGANLTNYLNANIGNLENTGVELELNVVAFDKKDLSWIIGANMAWNKSRVTKLTTDDERADYYGVETGDISGGTGNTIQVHQTGHAPNSFFVFQQVYDAEGKPIEGLYADRNGDGKIDIGDKYICHKAAPDFAFGINTTLTYKSWTLAVSAHANIGNYVYDNVRSNGECLSDLWTNNSVSNRVNGALQTNFRNRAQYNSDYYIKDASFFKLDNITIARNFDFRKTKHAFGLNVFATVQNVATITKYTGIDPEIFSGIDNHLYPRPRTYILGVKFNF